MRTRFLAPTALLMIVLASSCGEAVVNSTVSEDQAVTHEVRGVVHTVGKRSLHISHEAIPDFRDPSGEVVGMAAMSMDFALHPDIVTDDLQPGDKVAFDLRIDWDAPQPALITTVEALPEDTELDF